MKTFPGRERNPSGSFDIKKSRGGYLCRCFKTQLFWKSRLFSLFLKFDVVIRVTYLLCEKYLRFFMHGLCSGNLLMGNLPVVWKIFMIFQEWNDWFCFIMIDSVLDFSKEMPYILFWGGPFSDFFGMFMLDFLSSNEVLLEFSLLKPC